MGHRMSALPIAKYCGRSPVLGSQYGAGRGAVMGRAFHASTAGEPDAASLLARLTEAELEQVTQWHRPGDIEVNGGTLTYADATKEVEVALDCDGMFTADIEHATTVGHLDFAWVVERGDKKIAYVADIKRSEWTVSSGTDSLQLRTYGYAWAMRHDCDAFCVGIWAATEGEWQWSDMFDMFDDGPVIWEEIKAAATTPDEAITGTHCTGCWSRFHCAEHLLPASLPSNPDYVLAKFTEGGEGLQTQADARKALELVKAMEHVLKVAKSGTQEWARRNGGILNEDGSKRYLPIITKGRASLDAKSLKADHPDVAAKYTKTGSSFDTFRWVKA